jgi:lactoylglutathione lyase
MKLSKIDAVTLFVADPRSSREFYERVFEVKVLVEDANSVAFAFEGAIINVLARAAAPELVAPADVATANSGASFQITLEVDDVDQACARLAGLGVALLNGPVDRPWGIRTASFADPDGHIWEVAAQLPKN